MKTLTSYFFILTFLLISVTAFSQSKQIPSSLVMEDLKGKKVNLKEYIAKKDKVTVISFWATWCKPCKEELDNIAADYYDDWVDTYDIAFLAISMDNSRTQSKVPGIVDTKGWEYDILCNPENTAFQSLGFNSVPFTLLIDQKGNIVYKHSGYKSGDEEDLEAAIEKASN